uniref:Terminal uridylyl transferase 7 n=1 Tax=Chelonoidis abingdonii TaxID=106734 RepID=A0A8C0H8Y5_CHEAB
MGDAAKPCFAKRTKERGVLEEEELKRNPLQHDYHPMKDYRHGKKIDMGFQKKKGTQGHCGNTPRKGPHSILSSSNSFKNMGHNQGVRINDTQKDQIKKWISDDHRGNSDSSREYKSTIRIPVINRTRKDSFHEVEGAGSRNVRRQLQKDLNEEMSDTQKGNFEMKKHRKPRRSRRTEKEEYDQDDYVEGLVIDESMLSVKELLGLQQAEERLKRDCIYRLKKRPRNYPTAKYTCKLCDALIESVTFAHKHVKEKKHKKNIKEKQEEELLTALPPPIPSQIQAIGVAIENVVQEIGLNNEDLEQRLKIKTAMEDLLHQQLPDCSLRLYGSSWSRFGFKTSDVNIDVQFPANMAQPDVLLLVQESLKNSESFIDVDADFHARVPVVVCREKQSGLVCKVSAGNESACLTTNHLATLGKLEPTLVPLVIAFRYWAKLCCADRPEEGGLPSYAFALMVIFFLQQRKEPFLPVYLGLWIGGFSLDKLVNFNLKDVENDTVIWEYNPAVDDADSPKEASPKRGKVSLVFDSGHQCSAPVGQLWVELLRFYALEFNLADLVISIRLKEAVSRESKDWPKKRIAVEDPYSVKRNVARTLNSQLVYEYILHCLRSTYKYFALPHKKPTKSSPKKPLNVNEETSQRLEPEKDAIKHNATDMQNVADKMGQVVATDCINIIDRSIDMPEECTIDPSKVFVSESLTEEELADDDRHLGIAQEDSDFVIEDMISGDNEDSKPSYVETESGNEEEEEEEKEHDQDKKWQKNVIVIDQGLDAYSENGDLPNPASEHDVETYSISETEGVQSTVVTERDEFGLECNVILDDKAEMDEESTEETDELDDSLNKFAPSLQDQISEVNNSDEEGEEEEEEQSLVLNHTECGGIVTAEDELDNTYTVSGDEDALSEEEEELSISVKYEETELEKNIDKSLRVDLNEEDFIEKGSLCEEGILIGQFLESELFYEFNKPAFTKGKSPMVVCSLCKREGHLKRDCPEDFKKIELDPLPALTPRFSNILDQVCIQCYKDFAPNIIEDQAREHIRQNLESFIRQEFPGTRLNLFGSSKNGFGFKQSDLDICMTIDGLETSEGLDCIRIIEELARVLKKHSGLKKMFLPITTFPILNFHIYLQALHNTRLLSSYAAIDSRVKYLCYTMKVFTKMCDIGDASRGSLSSYAYTLMMLYFLQQRNPPVIPVLQEIYKEPKKPEILVDGWNVYFFDKIDELPACWPDYGSNTESVGELWLGLLRFYTEEFDFKEHVICIRRKNLLTTFKKQWTSKYIVIEDPFDLNHNLGAGLSRKMTNFIMKAFINGRRVFGTPIKGFPKEYPSKMEYFFDPEVLTEGELAPNDRCCRICGKIGHFMKDCPMRRKLRGRHDREDIKNQRYIENNEKRSKEDKEIQNKTTEKDTSMKEGTILCTPQKNKLGMATMDTGRDKASRQSAEKWKRQEDRDLREKRCFICGREGHIKKECPQYKGVQFPGFPWISCMTLGKSLLYLCLSSVKWG